VRSIPFFSIEVPGSPVTHHIEEELFMPCLFALIAVTFPRIGVALIWLARPTFFSNAFNGSWLWPILGIIFLPFTTLMYVIMWDSAGLAGWEWFWLFMAVLVDVMHWTSSTYYNRERIPGYTNSSGNTI
jgi:hypothetical protein